MRDIFRKLAILVGALLGSLALFVAFVVLTPPGSDGRGPAALLALCLGFWMLIVVVTMVFTINRTLPAILATQAQQAAAQAAQHAEITAALARIAHATELTAAELAALRKPKP